MATRLFPSNLISVEIYDLLPPGYIIRPLERGDHGRGFFDCLKSLTWTGEIDERQFQERFDWMRDKSPGWFYDVVIEYEEEIVATGVLIVERKFIWNLGMVGHLEEICVRKEYQGKGLGKALVEALNGVAQTIGCLKTILNCSPEKSGFYEKCGYSKGGLDMSRKFEGCETDGSSSESSSE